MNAKSIYVTATYTGDHTYSGLCVSAAVGESVVYGTLVYFDCSEVEYKKADYNAIGTMPAVGVALETKGDGETCKILLWGYIRDDSWDWTIDDTEKVVYAGAAGAISETAVSGSGDYSQVVGVILTGDTILFCPSPAMAKVA